VGLLNQFAQCCDIHDNSKTTRFGK